MRAGALALTLVLLSCNPKNPEAHKSVPAPLERPGEVLSLKAWVLGEACLGMPVAFMIRIKNAGTKAIDVMKPVDGSEGLRYPIYSCVLTGPDGKRIPGNRRTCLYCNPLRKDDLLPLEPGEEFDPQLLEWWDTSLRNWVPTNVGKHKLRVTIDFSASDTNRWCGSGRNDVATIRTLLERVPRQRLEATVDFEVVQ